MPKLILQFEKRVLQEVPLEGDTVTIGRLPGNTVVIDNPAVSGQHARVLVEGSQHILEDLNSRNGTFVNDRPINRHPLREGDDVRVGKHHLIFRSAGVVEPETPAPTSAPGAPVQDLGGTVLLDTKRQKEVLAKMAPEKAPSGPVGTLTVLSGRAEKPDYVLEAQTTLIGKSDRAQVRLKGWFKPPVAAAITRKGTSYLVTPLSGKTRVNNQPLTQAQELQPGDVLRVSGVLLQFAQKE